MTTKGSCKANMERCVQSILCKLGTATTCSLLLTNMHTNHTRFNSFSIISIWIVGFLRILQITIISSLPTHLLNCYQNYGHHQYWLSDVFRLQQAFSRKYQHKIFDHSTIIIQKWNRNCFLLKELQKQAQSFCHLLSLQNQLNYNTLHAWW